MEKPSNVYWSYSDTMKALETLPASLHFENELKNVIVGDSGGRAVARQHASLILDSRVLKTSNFLTQYIFLRLERNVTKWVQYAILAVYTRQNNTVYINGCFFTRAMFGMDRGCTWQRMSILMKSSSSTCSLASSADAFLSRIPLPALLPVPVRPDCCDCTPEKHKHSFPLSSHLS